MIRVIYIFLLLSSLALAGAGELPIGVLVIPDLGLHEAVWEAPLVDGGWNPDAWAGRVAHLGGTGWLRGEDGCRQDSFTITLVSHNGGALQSIPSLRLGNIIYLYDGKWEFIYQVAETGIVDWQNMYPVMPTAFPTLTLFICWGIYDSQRQDYDQRYYVRAERINVREQSGVVGESSCP